MMDNIISFNSGRIYAETAGGEKDILSDVSFSLKEGEKLALIGRTGSGKTMTALAMMNLLPKNVYADGMVFEIKGRVLGKDIVYIPQNGSEYLNPSEKIKNQIFDTLKMLGCPKDEMLEKAKTALLLSGLESDVLDKYPFQLSGGMNQRVCIALASLGDPLLLIADEPTNGLDEKNRENFISLLETVFPKTAKLIITHDPRLAKLCDQIVFVGEKYDF